MLHALKQSRIALNITRGFSSKSKSNSLLSWYKDKLETDPIKTKAVTSGLIAGLGDLNCQYLVQNDEKALFTPDWVRTCRFFALGSLLVAPVVHNWYGFLGRTIPGNSSQNVLKRTIFDQFVFAPLFCCTFMSSLMTLEGKNTLMIRETLQRDISDVMIANWGLWIPAQMINFRYVPLPWQVLYSNCVAFIWNTYLSWKTQENSVV